MLNSPLPDINLNCLSRGFSLDLPNIEVTSLDISSTGCYILAGCSNGMVILFDMTSSDRNGTLVGHIRAKGMHTNLLVTVKFTQDSRFCFAGVMKGSMEMLAVDVGQIQFWHENALIKAKSSSLLPTTLTSSSSIKQSGKKSKGILTIDNLGLRSESKAAPLVCTYNHLDPKLRGFGAVTRLRTDENKYILICGRGIKNVHVWMFTIKQSESPKWTCLYDVTTNGVTIEALGFRERLVSSSNIDSMKVSYRLEMLSKSSSMGIRVWDLSHLEDNKDEISSGVNNNNNNNNNSSNNEGNVTLNKIPYEDIPSSSDCRAFSENGEISFGGTYNFSIMKIEPPKDSNREIFEVPSRSIEDDNGQRKRRMMRQIQEVLTTQDGQHALALCTDGGVLYYHHNTLSKLNSNGNNDSDDNNNNNSSNNNESGNDDINDEEKIKLLSTGSLIEFQSLTREVDIGPKNMTDGAWCLKRVGCRGAVVLVRSCKNVNKKSKNNNNNKNDDSDDDDDDDDNTCGSLINISLLSDLVPEDVSDTCLPLKTEKIETQEISSPNNYLTSTLSWTRWNCYYHDPSATLNWDSQINNSCSSPTQSFLEEALSETSDLSHSISNKIKPPTGKNKSTNNKSNIKNDNLNSQVLTPLKEKSSSSNLPNEFSTPSSSSSNKSAPLFSTPSTTTSSSLLTSSSSPSTSALIYQTPSFTVQSSTLEHLHQMSPVCLTQTLSRNLSHDDHDDIKSREMILNDIMSELTPSDCILEEISDIKRENSTGAIHSTPIKVRPSSSSNSSLSNSSSSSSSTITITDTKTSQSKLSKLERNTSSSSIKSLRSESPTIEPKVVIAPEIKKKRQISLISNNSSSSSPSSSNSFSSNTNLIEPPLKKIQEFIPQIPPLPPIPKIIKIVPSTIIIPKTPIHPLIEQCQLYREKLLNLSQTFPPTLNENEQYPYMIDRFRPLLLEQNRIQTLFYSDTLRDIQLFIERSLQKDNISFNIIQKECFNIMNREISRYKSIVNELMLRQSMEYQIECFKELAFLNQDYNNNNNNNNNSSNDSLSSFLLPSNKWYFFYSDMYSTLRENINLLFNSFDESNMISIQEKSLENPIRFSLIH